MLTEHHIHLHSSAPRRYIDRILCPTDLSPDSDQALGYAVALARAYGAKLFVCHCVEASSPDLQRHIKELFKESIGPYVSMADVATLDWEGIVVEGNAADAIAREAAERRVDLIVMRSRRRPYRAALLGSTAESICRTGPCPVLVTHPQEREWVDALTGKINLKRVLVAHDFSDCSELALSYALPFAQEYQSELHLIHVLPTRLESAWFPPSESAFHKAARRLKYAVPAKAHSWCKIEQVVREGQPYREVLSYAEENNIDLICMGAHGAGFGKWALYGSNVDRVLRQAPCPIFVARPLRPASLASIDAQKTAGGAK